MEIETTLDLQSVEQSKDLIRKNVAKGICLTPDRLDIPENAHLKKYILNWYENLYYLKFLSPHNFEEQIYHGPQHVQIKQGCDLEHDSIDLTEEDFQLALEILCLKKSVNWNATNPFVSFDLRLRGQNYRASLLHFELCKEHGSKLFLRQHQQRVFELEKFQCDAGFFKKAIKEKKNILVSGATGSGKTSFLNSLLKNIDQDEHLIVLEDTYEILCEHSNSTRLLARHENAQDLKNFMAFAMRMSPDRLVLGELRSSEVGPFLLAMNSGHKGLLSTVHANGGEDAINRIALLMQLYSEKDLGFDLVIKLITSNIDYVVHLENKKVVEICEILGSEGRHIFYEKINAAPSRDDLLSLV